MKKQTHSRPTENGRAVWYTERLWSLAKELPTKRVAIAEIKEFDMDCWFGNDTPTCREVARHAKRIMEADLSFPVILSSEGLLMDGGHRIAKAWIAGEETVSAVQFTQDPEPDFHHAEDNKGRTMANKTSCRLITTMNLRCAIANDLPAILRLYHFLNPEDPMHDPEDETMRQLWRDIMANDRLRYFVAETNDRIVATCTLTLIPNLTRNLKPYGVIENVVTDPEFRQQGFATAVLRHALNDAWSEGCYKVMLSTGSKTESTLRFYENAGFKRGVKTGFVAHPEKVTPIPLLS